MEYPSNVADPSEKVIVCCKQCQMPMWMLTKQHTFPKEGGPVQCDQSGFHVTWSGMVCPTPTRTADDTSLVRIYPILEEIKPRCIKTLLEEPLLLVTLANVCRTCEEILQCTWIKPEVICSDETSVTYRVACPNTPSVLDKGRDSLDKTSFTLQPTHFFADINVKRDHIHLARHTQLAPYPTKVTFVE